MCYIFEKLGGWIFIAVNKKDNMNIIEFPSVNCTLSSDFLFLGCLWLLQPSDTKVICKLAW